MKALILGGVRSGKSQFAEALALRYTPSPTLIATGSAGDEEMAARIAAHRDRRSPNWTVKEEPALLAAALTTSAASGAVVVVDCLTLWLTNLLCHADRELLDREVESFLGMLSTLPGHQVFVANEVGLGVMPINALARRFGDTAGVLHQRLAAVCDTVILMVAGLPLIIKGDPVTLAPNQPRAS